MMTKILARKIVETAERLRVDMEIYEGYSGRGMYGEETTAVTYRNENDLLVVAAELGLSVAKDVQKFRRDSLGKSRIIY